MTEQTAELRRSALGASEFGAVLGLDRFKQPLDVWMEKTGRAPAGDEEAKPTPSRDGPRYWGLKLERQIAEGFSDETGKRIRADNRTYRLDEHRVMAHLDFVVVGEKAAVECKRPGMFNLYGWGEPGSDEIPGQYFVQCQGQAWIAGRERVYVPRLVGHDFAIYEVEPDPRWQDVFAERFGEFWWYVDHDKPPQPIFEHRTTADTLRLLFGGEVGDLVIEWTEREGNLLSALQEISKRRGDMERAEKALKNELRWRLGNAAWAVLPDGRAYKREIRQRQGHFVEPTSFEVAQAVSAGRVPKAVKQAPTVSMSDPSVFAIPSEQQLVEAARSGETAEASNEDERDDA